MEYDKIRTIAIKFAQYVDGNSSNFKTWNIENNEQLFDKFYKEALAKGSIKDGNRYPNFIEEILHGKAPLHNATVSERDVIRGLAYAIDYSVKIPNGNMLTGQLCEVANLLWEWHNKMQKVGLR